MPLKWRMSGQHCGIQGHGGCRGRTYVGLTESSFKQQFTGHRQSFANISKKDATALSQYVWKLGSDSCSIKWEIMDRCKRRKCGARRCDLCLTEKLRILKHDKETSLNKRSELLSKCRHGAKYKLIGVT